MLFATSGYVLLPTSFVWANPTGEQVVGGAATFERQGNTLTVHQTTERLAVNWQDFSIAAGETTHFNMPSSASIALNRVLGGNPSQIYGTLSSNGNIILVNNAGIFVGPGGVVNAASFVGSTLDIDPQQFMNAGQGGFHLHGDSYAPIVNQGNITAEKGDVFLIAQKVENRGIISAPNGRANLVGVGRAADRTEVVLHEVGGAGFAVRVTQLNGEAAQGLSGDLPDGEELLNEGEIAAAQAELNASGNIYALAIKNSGTIRAKAVVAQADGTVRLDGGSGDVFNAGSLIAQNAGDVSTAAGGVIEVTGQNVTASPESVITAAGGVAGGDGGRVKLDSADTTLVQGKVDVTAPSAGAQGGKVELLGERVGLFQGAKVDASGGAGGGTVLAGGDYLGGRTPAESLQDLVQLEDEPVKNAKAVAMAESAEIRADATANGDGGKIILWSDEYTGFYGELFARGSTQGGDGGFVETSSLGNLQAMGTVLTSGEKRAGMWLLDPLNVTIADPGTVALPPSNIFTPTTANSQVTVGSVNTALQSGDTVTILTEGSAISGGSLIEEAGNITIAADISDSNNGGSLVLVADNNITIAGNIALTGDLTLALPGALVISRPVSVNDIIMNVSDPASNIAISASVQTTGNMRFLLGGNFDLNSNTNLTSGGDLSVISSAGALNLLSNVSAVAALSLTAGTSLNANGTLAGSSVFTRANNGGLTVNQAITSSAGNITLQTGTGSITLNNSATATGGRIEVTADSGDISVNSNLTSANNESVSVTANNGVVRVGANAILRSNNDSGNVSVTGRNGVNLAGILQSLTGGIFVTSQAGAISRNDADTRRIQVGTGNLELSGFNGVNAQIFLNNAATVRAYADAGEVVIDSAGNDLTINADAANNISITADNDLTITRLNERNFDGIDVSLTTNANNGNIVLGGNNLVATGTFSATPNGSGQILFGGSVFGDEVNAPTQNYNGPVGINSGVELVGSTDINFNGTLDVGAGLAITSNGAVDFGDSPSDLVTLNDNLTLFGNANATFNANVQGGAVPGGLSFLDDDNQTGLVRLNAFAGTVDNPIAFFVKEGGTIEYAGSGGLVIPAINLIPGGRLVLLNTTLFLATDTLLAVGGDITLSAPIDSFNDNNAVGLRLEGSGQVILNGSVGANFALRTLQIDTSAGDGDIVINAPVAVRSMELSPGGVAFPDADNGTITLAAGGNLVVEENLRTNAFNVTTGAIRLRAGGEANENIQVGAVNLLTRGGSIEFGSSEGNADGNTFFVSEGTLSALLDTLADNASGDITFHGSVDGNGTANLPLTIRAGTGTVNFERGVGQGEAFNFQIVSAGGVAFGADAPVLFGGGSSSITSLGGNVGFGASVDKLGGTLSFTLGSRSLTFGSLGQSNPFDLTVASAGGVTFNGAVLFGTGTTSINSFAGDVAFNSTLNKIGGSLLLALGEQNLTLAGNIGQTNPFGLTVSSSRSVTLSGDVRMGGDFLFDNLAGNFTASRAIDGPFALRIVPVNDNLTLSFADLGTTLPILSLTVEASDSSITLNGDIVTAGGSITFGSPALLGASVSLKTNALGSSGGNLVFANTLTGTGAEDLTINAGAGTVFFGGSVNQINNFTVPFAGFFTLTSEADLTVAGNINITPQVITANDLTMTAGNDLVLLGGVVARRDPGTGAKVTLTADGAVRVDSLIEISGRSGTFAIPSPDGSSFTTVGTSGFDGGKLVVTGATVTLGPVNALGSNNFVSGGKGGNGGSVTLTSAGDKTLGAVNVSGGNGGPAGIAGNIILGGAGNNILTGNITGNGGNGEAGSPGGSAAVFDFSGNTILLGAASVQMTALGGNDSVGGGRGQDGNFTFGVLRSAASAANPALSAQNNLILNTGRGSIRFGGGVGVDNVGAMGQITVVNALNVTFEEILLASRFVQNASVPEQSPYLLNSSGQTSFNDIELLGSGFAMELTGYNFRFGGTVNTQAGGGSIQINNGGVVVIADAFTLGGSLFQATLDEATSARVEIGANLLTSSGAIVLGSDTRLTADTVTISTGTGGGTITFNALLDSDTTPRNLVLESGGTVTLAGAVGSLNPLASLVTDAGGSLLLDVAGTEAVPSLNVSGGIEVRDQMSLGDSTVVKANNFSLFDGGTIEGAQSLKFLLSGGPMVLQGQVGGVTALSSLWIQGADSGISLNFAGSETFPTVRTTGQQYYGSAVTLDSDAYLLGGAMTFVSTIRAAAAGGQGMTLNSGGLVRFQDLVGGNSQALAQLAVLGTGSVQFLANPGLDASVTTTGSQLYGAALLLGQDTSLLSTVSGDFDFTTGATIDSLTLNEPRALTINGQGKIVMEANLGTQRRLGAVGLTAVGDITVLEGLNTFGADVDMSSTTGTIVFSGAVSTGVAEQLGGNISMAADQEIQLEGQLASRGGTVGLNAPVYISGTSFIDTSSGGLQNGTVTFGNTLDGVAALTIQSGTAGVSFSQDVGYQSPFLLTVGSSGGVTFQQRAMLGSGSGVTTADGNVVFQGLLDVAGGGALTIQQSPFDTATFSGKVGSQSPFAMTVSGGGGVRFEDTVYLGGAFRLFSEGAGTAFTGVEFLSTVDGAGSLLIDSRVGNVLFGGAVGGGTALGSGGLQIGVGSGTTTLTGNITTEGGQVSIGNKVSLAADITIFTGAGLRTTGSAIFFNQEISAPGGERLTLDAGSGGGILLGGSVGSAPAPVGAFTIRNGGGVAVGSSGGIYSDGDILISPKLTGLFPKGSLILSSTLGGITLSQGGILTGEFRDADNNSDGSNLTMTAAGSIVVGSVLDLSGGEFDYTGSGSGFNSGFLTLVSSGGSIELDTVQLLGGDAKGVGAGGTAGRATLVSDRGISVRQVLANGGKGVRVVGGAGGELTLVRTGATGAMTIGTLAAQGGASDTSFGGVGGTILVRADLGDLAAPTDLFVAGGLGASDRLVGQGGLVTLEASAGNLSFANPTLSLDGDSSLRVVAGENLILATNPDVVSPDLSTGGVILNLNSGALRTDRRGTMSFAYGSANNGGQFYMPSSSYLLSNGGDVAVNAASTANLVAVGRMTLSGITTSGTGLNGGRILVNQAPAVAGLVGDVSVLGTLETSGGVPTTPAYGRSGGQVLITGGNILLNKVITRGSDSLSSATVPAFGGAGGDVSVTGTSITLRRDLDTSGGNGLGTGDANGGAGGQIQFFGDVLLSSGSSQVTPTVNRTIISLNTQGGTLKEDGENGLGGNILIMGSVTGTQSTSNTLDLRYGSGIATLGSTAADTITLGTLITAANHELSTGTLVLNGALEVGTLTTYAQGYGIQINGGGTVVNTVTFNNTGDVALGNLAATTAFAGGLNASAPASVRLQGLVESGDDTNPGTGTPMTFGVAQLVGHTILNSNGSNLSLGRIDGAFDLTFAAGIGAGVVDLTSTVGANTRLGTITVSEGIVQPVTFRDAVSAAALAGGVGTALSFFGDVNLTGAAVLQGLTTLDNTLFESQSSTLDFTAGAASSLNQVVLASGPIRLTGDGSYAVAGTVTGAQTLKLAGAGTKTFLGGVGEVDVPVGSEVAGIEQADGSGAVTFQGDVFVSGVSNFEGSVALSGMTFTSADQVDFGGDLFDTITLEAGTVTLAGQGGKVFKGSVESNLAGTVVLSQAEGAGKLVFENNVTSTGLAGSFILAGEVELAGLVFSSNGEVSFSKSVLLRDGGVTLTGDGTYSVTASVDGGQNLVLAGNGQKSFLGALGGTSAIGTGVGGQEAITISGGLVTFGDLTTASGILSDSALILTGTARIAMTTGDKDSVFNETVTLQGASFLSGLGVTFAGDVVLAASSTGGTTSTLGGTAGGSYSVLGGVAGPGFLVYSSLGDITFSGIVGGLLGANRVLGISQDSTAGVMQFQDNVFTGTETSNFGGSVILNGMAFDAGGTTAFTSLALAGTVVDLEGAGSQTVTGTLTGNGVTLNLGGVGSKTLAEITNLGDLNISIDAASTATLGGNVVATSIVQTAGNLVLGGASVSTGAANGIVDLEDAASVTVLGGLGISSGTGDQIYGSLSLQGSLTSALTGVATFRGAVVGAGNLAVEEAGSVSITGTIANSGTFQLAKTADINLGTGLGATLDAASLAAIRSGGGAVFDSGGDVIAENLTANTALTLDGDRASATGLTGTTLNLIARSGDATVDSGSLTGLLGMKSESGALNNLVIAGASSAANLDLSGVSVVGLENLVTPLINNVVLSGGGLNYAPSGSLGVTGTVNTSGNIALAPGGSMTSLGSLRSGGEVRLTAGNNMAVTGPVSAPSVRLAPQGNLVTSGNNIQSPDIRALTRDFFANYPANAGIAGTRLVVGATSLSQLGPNEVGVATPLLAGAGGPYITEFTTGTGQPYILATQNAVPPVMMGSPVPLTGAFAKSAEFSSEELEMMTPEERAALEVSRRQQAARVILQREGGRAEEIGAPVEGQVPQAKAAEPGKPAPTAQVWLGGKPLASKPGSHQKDSTQLLRLRPGRAVAALRTDVDPVLVMDSERMAAEVSIGSMPVAGNR